jgi:hypothetical protein
LSPLAFQGGRGILKHATGVSASVGCHGRSDTREAFRSNTLPLFGAGLVWPRVAKAAFRPVWQLQTRQSRNNWQEAIQVLVQVSDIKFNKACSRATECGSQADDDMR